MTNPSTPVEQLVDAVQNLKQFLPDGCELFGQGDLKIIGPYPAGAGGSADIWLAEMSDGIRVAIKSYRYYSSSSRLSVYLVSGEHPTTCSSH